MTGRVGDGGILDARAVPYSWMTNRAVLPQQLNSRLMSKGRFNVLQISPTQEQAVWRLNTAVQAKGPAQRPFTLSPSLKFKFNNINLLAIFEEHLKISWFNVVNFETKMTKYSCISYNKSTLNSPNNQTQKPQRRTCPGLTAPVRSDARS